jgi:hypothetical protein
MAKWLAWVTARDHINRLNFSPVDCGDVTKIGNAGVMVCEDLAGSWFDLCIPGKVATNGDVKAAITCEQRANAQRVHFAPAGLVSL